MCISVVFLSIQFVWLFQLLVNKLCLNLAVLKDTVLPLLSLLASTFQDTSSFCVVCQVLKMQKAGNSATITITVTHFPTCLLLNHQQICFSESHFSISLAFRSPLPSNFFSFLLSLWTSTVGTPKMLLLPQGMISMCGTLKDGNELFL